MPSSPVRSMGALVSRWRGGRATLSLERRRARTMMGGAVVIAGVVLLTSFPLAGVLSQRSALSSTGRELSLIQAENATLARQVAALAHPSAVAALARHDYGFVPKGQRAYDILPPSSASAPDASSAEEVPLSGPPVVPGSVRSQALIGVVTTAGAATGPSNPNGPATTAGSGPARVAEPPTYWGRVIRTLEFWN
jgi:hypothetical protein